MAKKKIGLYGHLESTANNKVEDLFIVVDESSINFSVKNIASTAFIAFESFENTSENSGWNQLVAYLQNNSKLIQGYYKNIHFVLNRNRVLLSKKQEKADLTILMNELNIIFGSKFDEEVMTDPLDLNYNIVYSVPDELQTLLPRVFPAGKWSHYAKHLVNKQNEDGVCIYVFEHQFCLHIIQNGQTSYLKYWQIEGDSQNIYNVLQVSKSLDLSIDQMEINVTGANAEQLNWINPLMNYFRKSYLLIAPENGVGATLNKEYPSHSFAPYFIF